jgi:DGQHR domain-containing protein
MSSDQGWISITCIQIQQPIGHFYIAVIPSAELVRISFADRRRILERQREIEVVSGIQREISPKRVTELKQYVTTKDACFPTGVIVAIASENAKFDPATSTIKIRDTDDVAKIIDGQHRIEGLVGYQGPSFEMNVTIFINMEMEDQAIVFSTINLKQAPVANSLAYDLYDYATTRSPQKTCHNIARLLGRRIESPFYRRIMILGVATGEPNETLTQAAFVDPLLKLISANSAQAMEDRDVLKRKNALSPISDGEIRSRKLIFRNMFIRDEEARIAMVIWNYFVAVQERWPKAWSVKQKGLILNRTTGYRALMHFLPILILSLDLIDEVPGVSIFKEQLDKVQLDDDQMNTDEFKPGTAGQSKLRKILELNTRLTDETVFPAGRRSKTGTN